jgi:hypothetical protein
LPSQFWPHATHIGTEFFPDKSALAQAVAVAVYEKASERVWPRSRDEIPGFFDGFELLEPGLVPKHQWRSVVGEADAGTPNIQWGGLGRKPLVPGVAPEGDLGRSAVGPQRDRPACPPASGR